MKPNDGKEDFYVHYHDLYSVYEFQNNEYAGLKQPYNEPLDLKKLRRFVLQTCKDAPKLTTLTMQISANRGAIGIRHSVSTSLLLLYNTLGGRWQHPIAIAPAEIF